jgi:hypothetical protein
VHADECLDRFFHHLSWKDDACAINEHIIGVVYGELVASVPERAKGDRQIALFVWKTFAYGGAQHHCFAVLHDLSLFGSCTAVRFVARVGLARLSVLIAG